MKRAWKKILIAAAVMVTSLAAGVFASCKNGADQEELTKEAGYSLCVTYDANGGMFGTPERTYALVKENSLAPAPGYVDAKTQASIKIPTRRNHQLIAEAVDDGDEDTNEETYYTKSWFVAQTDEAGNVVYEGEGENRKAVLLSEEPWDFTKDKVTKDITLVAQWREVFRYVLCVTEPDENGKPVEKELRSFIVNPGDLIAHRLYNKDSESGEYVRRADYIRLSVRKYTFLDFYFDAALTDAFDLAYTHPGSREITETVIDPETNVSTEQIVETNDVKIYVKYLAGDYDLISNVNKEELSSTSKWYLLEDVDFGGMVWDCLDEFKGEIYGNGFAIKNFTVQSNAMKPETGKDFRPHSIFGEINGILENLTLENVTLSVKASAYGENVIGEQRVSFIAYGFGENGVIDTLTVKDCKIELVNSNKFSATQNTAQKHNSLWYTSPAQTQVKNVKIMLAGQETDNLIATAQ